VTVVAGILATPATAGAAATITFDSAGSPQSNAGLLSIHAAAPSDITPDSITAHLMSGGTDVQDVTGFSLTSGTAQDGTWTVGTAIAAGSGAGQLPVGSYAVQVDATDTGGDSVTGQDAGTLNFLEQPAITLSATPATVDFDHQSVTFSGTATGTPPGGSPSPLKNTQLTIRSTGSFSKTVTTDAAGAFSLTVQQPQLSQYTAAITKQTATVFAGTSASAGVTATMDPVQLTAKISAKQVNYGKAVTITGTASYQPGATSKPLAGSTVQLYSGSPQAANFKPFATAKTAADGTFAIHFTATRTATWTVYAGGLPNSAYLDQLLQQATVSLPQNVALPVQLAQFKASLSPFAVLTATGCLTITSQSPPRLLPLTVEYRAGRSGPWKSLGSASKLTGRRCGTGQRGEGFTSTATAQIPSAYYRVAYKGGPNDQPAATTTIHESKYVTRVTSVKVTPRQVHKGGKITVSGRLQVHVKSSWRDFARKQVLIVLKPKGSNTWFWIYKVTTSASGKFSKTFVDPVTADWSGEYVGDSQHFASQGASFRVTVNSAAGRSVTRLRTVRRAPAWLAGPGHLRAR
jgi:5-hydroxyisourate hydrolase-like protein (transthyretin family)